MEQQNLFFLLLVGIYNGVATLEGSLVVSYNTKDALTTQSSNCVPWYLAKRLGTLIHC